MKKKLEKIIPENQKILFVMFYHNNQEFCRYQLIFDNWKKLTKTKLPFKFLFVRTSLKEDIRHDGFQHQYLNLEEPKDLQYPKSISLIWLLVCRHIQENIDCKYWFWWEHDMCPISNDWLDYFDALWNKKTKIMGSFVTDSVNPEITYINGGAFYAKDYWNYIHEDYLRYRDYFQNNRGFDAIKLYKKDDPAIVILNDKYNMITSDGFFKVKGKKFVHGVKNDVLIKLVLQRALKI